MDTKLGQQKRRDSTLSLLDGAIEAMKLAKEVTSVTPAKAVFGSVGVLLTMIKDSMVNKADYVELGLACADACRALDRGMNGKRLDNPNHSVYEAVAQLRITVTEIQKKVFKQRGRSAVSRLVHAKNDKETIAAWRSDLNRVLHVFTAELVMSTHMVVSDLHRKMVPGQEGTDARHPARTGSVTSNTNTMGFVPYSTPLGESPPPPPRACFGRSELIEKIVGLAENLTPIALVGTGGIGKTSIALTVLHHDRIKERFGVNRRFIRCDRFPASCSHFLSRLSKVVGAGVINPEDLTPLRPFLSSMEMIIFLENAESILDPRGSNAQEIYAVVEELIQFRNICLCITSRISTIPPSCETLEIPTLPPMAARNAFHGIYKHDGQSNLVDGILRQLDFHPLSITLLATVAHHSKWDSDRLVSEWGRRRTDVLHTQHNESLAATIELSLSSPMFQELGPDARDLLGVIAFFPNGINENNIDWLFPTLPNRMTIFDNFCILSLTYRSNGFVTMLAPLRDFLSPKDPASSPLLRATKDRYFDRLSVYVDPNHPGFEEAQWIRSEDENVEHLLDVFISIDPGSVEVWDACGRFMRHLYWHKQRLVAFGPKIENLPDTHHSKPQCLFQLSRLFLSVGKPAEYKRLLTHTLKLRRGRGDYFHVAQTLMYISDANEQLTLHEEGIQRAKEALAIYKQFNNTMGQARAWLQLGRLLYFDDQLNAAEGAVSRTIHLLANYPNEFPVCECYRNLGGICQSKGKTEEAVKHFKKALEIASSFGWHDQLFWNSYDLAVLFFHEGRFNDAQAHIERAKLHAINNRYRLGRAMHLQAGLWYKQHRLKESKSEASRAASVFEELGDVKNAGVCRTDLQVIEEKMSRLADFNARGV